MWMMVAASPALKDLQARAREWLVSHGHTNDALAVLGRGQAEKQGKQQSRNFKGGQPSGGSGSNKPSGNKPGAQRKPKNLP
jgi:hypothetical protein